MERPYIHKSLLLAGHEYAGVIVKSSTSNACYDMLHGSNINKLGNPLYDPLRENMSLVKIVQQLEAISTT